MGGKDFTLFHPYFIRDILKRSSKVGISRITHYLKLMIPISN